MGMGTAILEIKLAQEIASINQDPLFLGFLYLQKSCGTVERGALLMTL